MRKAKPVFTRMFMQKKYAKAVGVASVLLWTTSLQGNLHAETLQEAATLTLKNNPTVLASQAAERRSEHAIGGAWAGYLPSLDVIGNAGVGNVENSTTRARAAVEEGVDDDQDNNPYGYAVRVNQELFSGFSTKYGVEAAEQRKAAATSDLMATHEMMSLKTAEVFLGVLRAQKVLELSKENVEEHLKTLNKERERAEKGTGNYGDVSQAESRLAQAEERKVRLLGQLEDAKTRYIEIVGQAPESLEKPVTSDLTMPMTSADAKQVAIENSPQMKSAEFASLARKSDVGVEEASFYPNLNLELSANSDWDSNGFEEKTVDNRAMLVLSYNLYNGGADDSRRMQAVELAKETEQKRQQVKRDIEKQAGVDFQAYLTAKDSLVWLNKREEASFDALKNYREQHRLGKRSLLDVLDVINELFQARVAVLDGELELDFSSYKVLADMGVLTRTLGVELVSIDAGEKPGME